MKPNFTVVGRLSNHSPNTPSIKKRMSILLPLEKGLHYNCDVMLSTVYDFAIFDSGGLSTFTTVHAASLTSIVSNEAVYASHSAMNAGSSRVVSQSSYSSMDRSSLKPQRSQKPLDWIEPSEHC